MTTVIDVVDMGLVGNLLAPEEGGDQPADPTLGALVVVSYDAARIAFSRAHQILVLFLEAAGGLHLVRAPNQDCVLSLLWLSTRTGASALLAGHESGALRCWSDRGSPLFSLALHHPPLVQLALSAHGSAGGCPPDATPPDVDLLCLHSAGVVAHARLAGCGFTLYSMLSTPASRARLAAPFPLHSALCTLHSTLHTPHPMLLHLT